MPLSHEPTSTPPTLNVACVTSGSTRNGWIVSAMTAVSSGAVLCASMVFVGYWKEIDPEEASACVGYARRMTWSFTCLSRRD